jgi:hypothetical protein
VTASIKNAGDSGVKKRRFQKLAKVVPWIGTKQMAMEGQREFADSSRIGRFRAGRRLLPSRAGG